MWNGPLYQQDDDSGAPGVSAADATAAFPDSPPGPVMPCPSSSDRGDPEVGKAYATGYQEGTTGLATNRSQYEWPGDRNQAWSSDQEQTYQQAYDQGFSDGQYNAEPPEESKFPSARSPGEQEGEEEEVEKFDEEAEYPDAEKTRYLELKMKAARTRRMRFFGQSDPESELTEEEREEYIRLYNRFGASDPDPEALPPPPEVEENEGEAE